MRQAGARRACNAEYNILDRMLRALLAISFLITAHKASGCDCQASCQFHAVASHAYQNGSVMGAQVCL